MCEIRFASTDVICRKPYPVCKKTKFTLASVVTSSFEVHRFFSLSQSSVKIFIAPDKILFKLEIEVARWPSG